jgi:hypothetical protein
MFLTLAQPMGYGGFMGAISVNPASRSNRVENGARPFQPMVKSLDGNIIPFRPAKIAGGIRDGSIRDIVDLSPLAQQFLKET